MSVADVLAGQAKHALMLGDVMDKLAELPDESVNCVVTSVPYWGLRDYGTATWTGGNPECTHKVRPKGSGVATSGLDGGKLTVGHQQEGYRGTCGRCGALRIDRQIGLEESPQAWVIRLVDVFREVRRVLRKDGTAWINVGDSYNTGTSTASKPSKKTDVGYWQNADTIGRSRADVPNLKTKDLIGLPWRLAFGLQDDGWYLRRDIIWHKLNPMPESCTDRPTTAHEYLFLLTKRARYWYDADAIAEEVTGGAHSRTSKMPDGWDTAPGGHGTFHREGREAGKRGVTPKSAGSGSGIKSNESMNGALVDMVATKNKRSVWSIPTEAYPDAHFATFPTDLVKPCILAGCPVGGVVLDIFVGSGTTVMVALRLDRRGIGIELNPKYLAQASHRIFMDAPLFNARV